MKPRTLKIRRWLLVLLTTAVMCLFIWELMQIQIVEADTYRARLQGRTLSTQTIKAVRGEIVDRNGTPLAANIMGYDVVIDKAFFPSDRQNDIILELVTLMEQLGEEWNDNLPITRYAPFSFEADRDTEIGRLRERITVQPYASADDVIYRMIEIYGLQDYTRTQARKIAGVRYDMEQRGFNMQTPYTFASGIGIASVVQIKERSYSLSGVDVTESAQRIYPKGDLAPHLIGTIGLIYPEEYEELKKKGYALNDVVGKSGAEYALEDYLRGDDGKREIYTDSYGEVVSARETVPPTPGYTVAMTLDETYQRVAQESLEAQIKFLQANEPEGRGREADAGAVVMLDAKTGQVLAAATYPSYDLSTYQKDYSSLANPDGPAPLLNRATAGQYAPGSTFKPTVAISGLCSNVLPDAGSTVNCTFVYTFYPDYQPKCLSHHGHINVVTALSYSCNIFFYDVGRRVGIDTIDTIAMKLGLGEPTGIELREETGRRSNPETKKQVRGEDWYDGDTLQSSIGQLLHMYTPLQLANYAATVGNRGTRMELTMINEIRDYTTGEVVEPFEAKVANRMDEVPQEAFEIVVRGMVAASRTGSASGTFSNYPIDVASKTGTPETTEGSLPNSTFICFAPADDPEIAIAVVIEKGWHGYTGAPVAKALFDEYFGYDVRAAWPSGPQQLKDQRAREAAQGATSQAPAQADQDNEGENAESNTDGGTSDAPDNSGNGAENPAADDT